MSVQPGVGEVVEAVSGCGSMIQGETGILMLAILAIVAVGLLVRKRTTRNAK